MQEPTVINKEPTIINIVSGKGGTGKTLLCACLADLLGNIDVQVLIIDLDIHVRGLTTLLYFHKRESLNLITSSQLSVANIFMQRIERREVENRELGISRYRSFDVLPAVARIDENLNFNQILPDSKDEAGEILKTLLMMVPKKYDLILLDSRAGYDEVIAATHVISSATVCVEEEDSISKITADNLVRQLSNDAKNPVFRLTNKARGIRHLSDMDQEHRGVTGLGRIPFDMDVMNNFGEKDFWEEMSRSLYRAGLTRAWNRLATKLNLKWGLSEARISPLASRRLEEGLGTFTLRDRVILSYGIAIALFGFGYGLLDINIVREFVQNPIRLTSLMMGVMGMMMIVFVLLRQGRKP